MLEVSDDFGFDLLTTEQDLFDIDHCAAGAHLAQDWDFPGELVSSIAGHHREPEEKRYDLENVVRIAWRFADTLGYAAFSPERLWEYEALVALLPGTGSSWLCKSPEAAREVIGERLNSAPM
jgi:hypothetical protein